MTPEDFNLFTASFSIIRAKKNLILQIENNIVNSESIINKHLGSKIKEVKVQVKDIQKKVAKLVAEKTETEKDLVRYEKVFLALDKKYFK